jgi:hypothetical protein
VDCYNAGATLLHIHVRDPKTAHISKSFGEYGEQIARLRKAVPKMILQVGGSISFAPEPGDKAQFQSYDSRHKLCEISPAPDQMIYDDPPVSCKNRSSTDCASRTSWPVGQRVPRLSIVGRCPALRWLSCSIG